MEEFLGVTRWMLRITDDTNVDHIEKIIKELTPMKYIIGSELSVKGKRHFHIYLEGQIKKSQFQPLMHSHGYRGVQMYNVKEADNSSKVKSYCIKDGDFKSFGIDDKLMEAWRILAHKKIKDGYGDKLKLLEEKFVLGDKYTRHQFGTDVLLLQVEYGIKPSRARHQPYMHYMNIKKDKNYAYQLNSLWEPDFL